MCLAIVFQNGLQKQAQTISMLSFYITGLHGVSFSSVFDLYIFFFFKVDA